LMNFTNPANRTTWLASRCHHSASRWR
jgi:hypothetical protein